MTEHYYVGLENCISISHELFSFYRRKDYKQLIERHKVLLSDLKRQLDIPRILVSEACKDLMEVDIESITEVN